jgi:Zn-dependent protease
MALTLLEGAGLILALIFAIVFHEVAHGWMALALGDTTARDRKRLSLNPLRHVDPIGTIVLPAFLKLVGAPIFGWAKPVPVDKWRLRNPRLGMMAVAAAGPGINLIMAALGAIALGLLVRSSVGAPQLGGATAFLVTTLGYFLQVNVFLALFNLLPIPPFDGSHIVEGFLPERAAQAYERLRPYGLGLMIILLIVLPSLAPQLSIVERFVLPPVEWALGQYSALVIAVASA